MGLTVTINGKAQTVDADPATPLLWVLRDMIGLTGTKFGCGAGLCGACSVHIEGQLAVSCQVLLSDVVGKQVTTIEGLRDQPVGQVLRKAWADADVVQCGYCQPGQIMAAAALIATNAIPNEADIDEGMRRNICRCGTYPRIRAAIRAAAKAHAA